MGGCASVPATSKPRQSVMSASGHSDFNPNNDSRLMQSEIRSSSVWTTTFPPGTTTVAATGGGGHHHVTGGIEESGVDFGANDSQFSSVGPTQQYPQQRFVQGQSLGAHGSVTANDGSMFTTSTTSSAIPVHLYSGMAGPVASRVVASQGPQQQPLSLPHDAATNSSGGSQRASSMFSMESASINAEAAATVRTATSDSSTDTSRNATIDPQSTQLSAPPATTSSTTGDSGWSLDNSNSLRRLRAEAATSSEGTAATSRSLSDSGGPGTNTGGGGGIVGPTVHASKAARRAAGPLYQQPIQLVACDDSGAPDDQPRRDREWDSIQSSQTTTTGANSHDQAHAVGGQQISLQRILEPHHPTNQAEGAASPTATNIGSSEQRPLPLTTGASSPTTATIGSGGMPIGSSATAPKEPQRGLRLQMPVAAPESADVPPVSFFGLRPEQGESLQQVCSQLNSNNSNSGSGRWRLADVNNEAVSGDATPKHGVA